MPDRILSRASWLAESVDPGGQASVGPPSVVIVPVEWGQLPLAGARGPDKDTAFVFWERLIPPPSSGKNLSWESKKARLGGEGLAV